MMTKNNRGRMENNVMLHLHDNAVETAFSGKKCYKCHVEVAALLLLYTHESGRLQKVDFRPA